jgi:hypothetical protein
MKNHRTLLAAASLTAVLALSGCWGDNNDNTETVVSPPVDVTEVPDSAGVSIGAFFSFILGLAAGDEKSEPLTIKAGFAVPADEAAEPTPLP